MTAGDRMAGSWWSAPSALLLWALPGSAPATTLREITFGSGTTIERRVDRSGAPVIVLHQRDGDISTSIDPGTAFAVWSRHGVPDVGDALAIRLDPELRPSGVSQKSKFEINVSRQDDQVLDATHGDRFVLKNGGSNDLAFTFEMDEGYQAPQRWVLHAQVWQCCSAHTRPVLAFQAVPGAAGPPGSVGFALIARNDDDRSMQGDSASGQHLRFVDGSHTIFLQRGRPYRILLYLSPDPGTHANGHPASRTGVVTMAVDGREVLHYRGAWGYSADPAQNVRATYAVKLGIYRAAQPTRQQVVFGDIVWSTDRDGVAPRAP